MGRRSIRSETMGWRIFTLCKYSLCRIVGMKRRTAAILNCMESYSKMRPLIFEGPTVERLDDRFAYDE